MFEAIEEFRQHLSAGEVLIGSGLSFTDPQVADALAESVDFFWIDLEHSAMSPEAMRGHLLAARSRRTAVVVRVPSSDTAFIKPVIDAGAPGVVVPQVKSVEEVRRIVADCRYPPIGQRGFGPSVPSEYGRRGGPDYVARANASLFVSVMIETVEAVEVIEEITRVPGLDSIVMGPHDLSGSLGVLGEIEHPTVLRAQERAIAAARSAGIFVGSGMAVDADYACLQAERGVQWLQIGGDCGYMVKFADEMAANVRSRLAG